MLLAGLKVAAETQFFLSIPYAVVFKNAQDYKSSKTY
jgi:hypothetical protein